jgi:hypothetical protein
VLTTERKDNFLPHFACPSRETAKFSENGHDARSLQNGVTAFSLQITFLKKSMIHDFETQQQTNKQTPWSESASELYRLSARRLSAK